MLSEESKKFLRNGQRKALTGLAMNHGLVRLKTWVAFQKPEGMYDHVMKSCPKSMRRDPVFRNIKANKQEAMKLLADIADSIINQKPTQN